MLYCPFSTSHRLVICGYFLSNKFTLCANNESPATPYESCQFLLQQLGATGLPSSQIIQKTMEFLPHLLNGVQSLSPIQTFCVHVPPKVQALLLVLAKSVGIAMQICLIHSIFKSLNPMVVPPAISFMQCGGRSAPTPSPAAVLHQWQKEPMGTFAFHSHKHSSEGAITSSAKSGWQVPCLFHTCLQHPSLRSQGCVQQQPSLLLSLPTSHTSPSVAKIGRKFCISFSPCIQQCGLGSWEQ